MPADGADTDRVRVVVAGQTFATWQSVDLDSDVFTPADAFAVRGAAPATQAVSALREGVACDVYVGDDRQMAGVIDDMNVGITSKSTTIELNGRDRAAYFVDNDAEPFRASHYTLQSLIKKLVKPSWGIRNIVVSNEANRKLLLGKKDRKSAKGKSSKGAPLFTDAPRSITHVDQAEKIARILDERCRQLGVTWWFTAEGDLFIGKPNYAQEPAFNFICFEPSSARAKYNNCDVQVRRSMADRYSDLIVVGQGQSSSGLFAPATTAKEARFKVTVRDSDLVARGIERRTVVLDSDAQNRDQAQRRADSELQRRSLSALVVRVTVPGFRQEGRLFTADTLATVHVERAGIEGLFWISQRRFLEERGRRRTELTLYPKGVWLA